MEPQQRLPKTAEELIPGSLKRSTSYAAELVKVSRETLEQMARDRWEGMKRDPYAALQGLLKVKRWKKALAQVDALLASNPLAAQLYLLRGQLIQLQGKSTAYALDDAEAAFKRALELDETYFDALVELMHFYDAVCADTPKTMAYAKQVKALAQKVLDDASDVLEDTTANVS